MAKKIQIEQKIVSLRKKYYSLAEGKNSLLTMLSEAEISEQVYNSNAIENSTLTLDETEKILLKIDLNRYISERELFEAKNLATVVSYIDNHAQEKALSLDMILFLHKILISNINDEIAGRFRKATEWVRVADHVAVDPDKILPLLNEMLLNYHASIDQNIVKRLAFFHLTFENIHPFVDGNGRIGRVLNNYLLIREGFVPINIKFIHRGQYYDAFNEFNTSGKTTIMELLIYKALTNSYHKRLAYLEGKHIISLKEYAKKNKQSHSNLINKAHRQTIEAFLEKGVWKIGI